MKTHWAYRVSVLCGILPMLVGSLILAGYAVTRWDWLALAGIFCIWGGLFSVFVGAIALVLAVLDTRRTGDARPRKVWGSAWLPVVLLLANFPLAVACTVAGLLLATEYRVQVQNHSRGPVEAAKIQGGGCDVLFGTVPEGASRTQSLWIDQDGTLQFSAIVGGRERSVVVDGYVTNNLGGDKVVEIQPDGRIRVSGGR